MATKAIPVVAAKVAATLADYPAYVKPSAMTGWTTLTTAEANSIRFYSDSSLTTELAREVVSADEIHVKVPSLTTSTIIYADYDGVRADLAATDTYGRNAVWSGYTAVYHLNEDPSGTAPQIIDSTGNGNTLTSAGSMTSADLIDGKVGKGVDLDGSNDALQQATSTIMSGNTQFTAQAWLFSKNNSVRQRLLWKGDGVGLSTEAWGIENRNAVDGRLTFRVFNTTNVRTTIEVDTYYPLNDWVMFHGQMTASGSTVYKNGVSANTGTITSGTPTSTNKKFAIGPGEVGSLFPNINADEYRYTTDALSANWITTEYNNQSDVATFCGTVTDVAAGGNPTGFSVWL